MTPIQALKVLLVVVLLSGGQLFFKLAAPQLRTDNLREMIISMALNLNLIIALTIYGVATLLWVVVLREVPLSRAYPITALGMLLVPAIGLFMFKEPFSWSLVGGGALLIAGVCIIARG
jgi:drug/metabolite transporter (DMT)-like permease